ncbi:hypothetical protein [uncultured Arcobacter sp.]|uniref:hypothetical protein n=1 Tax=uncultured Arcobacter sp. TaxID=165434 RepID=UPI002636D511|nr:hypothetical protein [uncultured Arcobacter sp.]
MSYFNFGYTCPIIDSNIKGFQEIVENYIRDIIFDVYQGKVSYADLDSNEDEQAEYRDYVISTAECIYGDVESYFEGTRKTNEDIRNSAEKQITDLDEEIERLKYIISDKEDEIDSLKSQIDEL